MYLKVRRSLTVVLVYFIVEDKVKFRSYNMTIDFLLLMLKVVITSNGLLYWKLCAAFVYLSSYHKRITKGFIVGLSW